MEAIGLLWVAAAIGYVGFQIKNANRLAIIRLEFDAWNAGWSKERRDEFERHITEKLKQANYAPKTR